MMLPLLRPLLAPPKCGLRRLASRKQKKAPPMSDHATRVLHEMTGELYSAARAGLVVERRGDKLVVEDARTRQLRECGQRSTLRGEHLVCGDAVHFQLIRASAAPGAQYQAEGLVVGREPRRNLLYRPDPLHRAAKKIKVIAANVDQLVIVVAPLPHVPLPTIDQLLVAGEAYGMTPLLLLNKSDLPEATALEKDLQSIYGDLNYPLLRVSAQSGEGLDELRCALGGRGTASLFVGQSGVGKSSLINVLLDEVGGAEKGQLEVGDLTRKGSKGAHTTTDSRLLRIPVRHRKHEKNTNANENHEEAIVIDSIVIDSPGIRELHLWHLNSHILRRAFPELDVASHMCMYRDCNHSELQQGCEVQERLRIGSIAPSRFNSYRDFLGECESK